MPYGVASVLLEMIPKLQARENLNAATVAAVYSGNIKKEDTRRIMRSWERSTGYKRKATRPKTREEFIAGLKARGIAYVEVKKPKTEASA